MPAPAPGTAAAKPAAPKPATGTELRNQPRRRVTECACSEPGHLRCLKSSSRPRESAAFFFARAVPACVRVVSIAANRFHCWRTPCQKTGCLADSLLETSWAQRTRRSWTTLTSFGAAGACSSACCCCAAADDGWAAISANRLHAHQRGTSGCGTPAADAQSAGVHGGSNSRDERTEVPASNAGHHLHGPRRRTRHRSTAHRHMPQLRRQRARPCCREYRADLRSLTLIAGDHPRNARRLQRPTIRPIRTSTMLEGNLIRRVRAYLSSAGKSSAHSGPGGSVGHHQQGGNDR